MLPSNTAVAVPQGGGRGGDPGAVARFDAKVIIVEDTCHIWTGCLDRDGYGRFRFQGKTRFAHRVAWFLEYGEWPEAGKEPDHTCRVPACVNVHHLEVVTHRENMIRGIRVSPRADPALCGAGLHEWTPENWYENGGGRRCRPCKLARENARYALKKGGSRCPC